MAHFLVESVFLTLSGGIVGLLCGLGAVKIISSLAGWNVVVSFWSAALPLQISLIVGIFFGLYPARQAAKVDPIVALRHH